MDHAITIDRARIGSLADALGDGGARPAMTRRRLAVLVEQVTRSDAFEVRVDGELAAMGGFLRDDDLDITEAWFAGGPALRRNLRASIDGICGVLLAAHERHGALAARVCEGAEKSLRFVRLLGFAPTALIEGGYRWAIFEPRRVA